MCQMNSKLVKRGKQKYVYKVFGRTEIGILDSIFVGMRIKEDTTIWHKTDPDFESDIGYPDENHVGKFSTFKYVDDAKKFFGFETWYPDEIWKVEVRDDMVLEGNFLYPSNGYLCHRYKTWLVSEFRLVEKIS